MIDCGLDRLNRRHHRAPGHFRFSVVAGKGVVVFVCELEEALGGTSQGFDSSLEQRFHTTADPRKRIGSCRACRGCRRFRLVAFSLE